MVKKVKAQPEEPEAPKLDTIEDCHAYISNIVQEHGTLRAEMMASLKIIAALVLAQGGEVRVPQHVMAASHNSDTFLNYKAEEKTNDFLIKVTTTPPGEAEEQKGSDILVAQDGSRLIH